MDNSDFDDSEGVIDYDLLYDLNVEHIYDDGPFAPGAHLHHQYAGYCEDYEEDDLEYADHRGGAGSLHEEFISDNEEIEEFHVDIGDPSVNSRESTVNSQTEEEASGNELPNRTVESESEDEYPDEELAELLEDLENYDNQQVVNNGPLRAAQLEDHDWDHEEAFEGEDHFDEEDDLGDRYLRNRYPLLEDSEVSDDLRSEASELQDSDYGSSTDSGNSHLSLSLSPSPASPASPRFEDYIDLVARDGELRAPQRISLISILTARGMENDRARREVRRMERAQDVAVERFGREVIEPPHPEFGHRRRTAAEAFGGDGGPRRGQRQQSSIPIDLIDLTEEPDSPPLPRQSGITLPNAPEFQHQDGRRLRHPHPPQRLNNNPRRQSGFRRTPSLARSDGSLLGPRAGRGAGTGPGGAPVIDLTGDEPPSPQQPMPPPRARVRPYNPNDYLGWIRDHLPGMPNAAGTARDILEQLHIGWGGGANPELEVQYLGEHQRNIHRPVLPGVDAMLAGTHHLFMENPLANNHPGHLNYAGNGGFAVDEPRPREKPVHIGPPPPREGFTRTCGDCVSDDTVMVCPSCDGELKYDPDDMDEPPAKKARTRKDQEEHHFWAVKSCGHVSFAPSCHVFRFSPLT